MKMIKEKLVRLVNDKVVILTAAFLLPVLAKASEPGPAKGADNVPYAQVSTVQGVLNYFCIVYGWLFYFLIALVVIFIVIGAYRYLTSGGEAEKVKKAQNTLLYAAIAVGVALLAWGIPNIIADFFGASGIASC